MLFQRSSQSRLVTCIAGDDLCNHKQGDHGACPLALLQMHSVLIASVAEPQIQLSFPQASESGCET